jgi:hypothetical protein
MTICKVTQRFAASPSVLGLIWLSLDRDDRSGHANMMARQLVQMARLIDTAERFSSTKN